MKKVLIITLILVISLLGYLAFFPRCKQPDDELVGLIQLMCIQKTIQSPTIVGEVCQNLRGFSDCDIYELEEQAVREFLRQRVNECAVSTLKKNNKCVDKYQELL